MLKYIRNFKSSEDGSISIELVLVTPIIVWALMSTLIYFDVFRAEAISTRASLTIADMLSRESDDPIDSDYLDGTRSLLQTLTEAEDDPDFRVTVYEYVEDSDEYQVIWSEHRGMSSSHTDATLALEVDQLPIMVDGDINILLETSTEYTAPFNIALTPMIGQNLETVVFETFTVISPRYSSSVCWQETSSSTEYCDLDDL